MDHLRNSDRDVDARNGVRVHHGWVYSHLAAIGGRSCGDTVDQWTSTRLRIRLQIEGRSGFPPPFQVIN